MSVVSAKFVTLDASDRIRVGQLPTSAVVVDGGGRIPVGKLPTSAVVLDGGGRIPRAQLPSEAATMAIETRANRLAATPAPHYEWHESDIGDVYVGTGAGWLFRYATARVVVGEGIAINASSAVLKLGDITEQSGPSSLMQRVSTGVGHGIQVAAAGLYRVSYEVTVAGVPSARSQLWVQGPSGPAPRVASRLTDNSDGTYTDSASGLIRLEVGDVCRVIAQMLSGSGSCSHRIDHFELERVRP